MAKPYSGSWATHLGALIACVNKTSKGDLISKCCQADHNPFKEEGKEFCMKCGNECEIFWKDPGDVLELGMGLFSTPYLHYACTIGKRKLLSLENDPGWHKMFKRSDFMHFLYENDYHKLELVDNFEESPLIDKEWDVVLVDQTPDGSRKETARKLANKAKYIILHDSNERHEKNYHYSEIYPLFKYKRIWTQDDRHATVLSNFNDLEDLW